MDSEDNSTQSVDAKYRWRNLRLAQSLDIKFPAGSAIALGTSYFRQETRQSKTPGFQSRGFFRLRVCGKSARAKCAPTTEVEALP